MSGRCGFNSQPSQTKDFKLVVEAPLSNAYFTKRVVHRRNLLTRCQNNVTGRHNIRLCLQSDISVRQHYKVVIQSVTSRHHPDGMFIPLQKKCYCFLISKSDVQELWRGVEICPSINKLQLWLYVYNRPISLG